MKNQGTINKWERIETIILYGVFICYILFLGKLLLLSRFSLAELFDPQRTITRSMNLIPFHSIQEYIYSSSATVQSFAFSNVAGNVIAFVPLGAFLLLFKQDKRIAANLLIICMISVVVEVIQGLFGMGAADVDDVILNSLGGLIGILGYRLLLLLFRDEKKVRIIATILSLAGLPVLLYLLFMIKLRL